MKKHFPIKLSLLISLLFATSANAQCDSIFLTGITVPDNDSSNIEIFVHNATTTHHIYLNLILTNDLNGDTIARANGGYLQLYPEQTNHYIIDTTVVFGNWELYYDYSNIPDTNHLSVQFDPNICNGLDWGGVAINETDQQQIKLYPNPAQNTIHLEGINPIKKVEVYNNLGQKVMQQHFTSEINITSLQKGIYYLKIEGISRKFRMVKN